MNFKCTNCGGSVIYSPKRKTMFCPHCDAVDSHKITGDDSLTNCPNCGAELEVGKYASSSVCPYCDNYVVFDKRVSEEYKPDTIIPFTVDKDDAKLFLRDMFKGRIFTPGSFLDEVKLKTIRGLYVPFFLYDMQAYANYQGTGTKSRTWRSGNYIYTETSYYDIRRNMEALFKQVPADASFEMPDKTMDLIEPFEYSELMDFDPKYLSGFFGEIYNYTWDEFIEHANIKTINSTKALLSESIMGYATLTPSPSSCIPVVNKLDVKYALFPVYVYDFYWKGIKYPIYVNGQTGKCVGRTPVSKKKVFAYGTTYGALGFVILQTIARLLEVIF